RAIVSLGCVLFSLSYFLCVFSLFLFLVFYRVLRESVPSRSPIIRRHLVVHFLPHRGSFTRNSVRLQALRCPVLGGIRFSSGRHQTGSAADELITNSRDFTSGVFHRKCHRLFIYFASLPNELQRFFGRRAVAV